MKPKVIEYDGHHFHLDSLGKYYITDYYYGHGQKTRKKKLLHRVIWEKETGIPIPKGYIVHHKDENKDNNNIDNLELKTFSQHRRDHMLKLYENEEFLENNNKHLANVNNLAKSWHKSKSGKKFHKKIGKLSWKKRKKVKVRCIYDNKTFETYFPSRAKFCHNNCDQKYRYHQRLRKRGDKNDKS